MAYIVLDNMTDEEFNMFQDNFSTEIQALATTLGIPAQTITDMLTAQAVWVPAWAAGGSLKKTVRNRPAIEAKNSARALYSSELTPILKRYVNTNAACTNEMRRRLHAEIPDDIKTRQPRPTSKPVCTRMDNSEHLRG